MIEPNQGNGAILGEQFRELAFHEFRISQAHFVPNIVIDAFIQPRFPVEIEREFNIVALGAGRSQFTNEVAAERRVGGLVARELAVPKAEAFAMASRGDDVASTHGGRAFNPSIGIEILRRKTVHQGGVVSLGTFAHGVLVFTDERVETEMEKHAQAGVLE